jgi:hypothetical protein
MQDLWEKLEEAASEGSDVPEKVSRLSWERKREICRAWMAESNLASPRAKPQAVSEESDDVDKTPTERGSIPISFSTENSGSLSSVDLPLSTGVSKVQHEGSGISNLTSHVRLEKPNTRIEKSLNREPTNTYRPASERGIGTFDQPRKSKTSVQSSSLSFSKEDLTNSLPRQKPTEERKTIPKSAPTGLEDKFSESSANTPENSSNTADISTDIGLSRDDIPAPISDRLALLVSIGEGSVPAPLDRTGETYRDKVSRARARQVEQSAARDAKLRNFDGSKPHEVRQVLKHLEGLWAAECRARYGDAAGAWQVQDRKMVEGLLKSYKLGMVESAMRYLAGAWPGLNKRLFKGNGGMVPTIGVLSRCHATLVPESAEYSELSGLADEYNNWWKNNPNEFPPDDLQRRYDAHSSKLKALGLVNP